MALRDFFHRKPPRGGGPPSSPPGGPPGDREAARVATHRRLDEHWNAVGAVEADVLGHLISPSFMGGPSWPTTRQAYRVVRRGNSVILATDGMADPFDEPEMDGNGFGMEMFLETTDILPDHAGRPGSIGGIQKSWAFELLSHFAAQVAKAGGVADTLDSLGALSSESRGVSKSPALSSQVPGHFFTDDDSVGVLIGGPLPDFPARIDDMPLSPVRIVPVVLLTAAELEAIRAGGKEVRLDIVARLAASPSGHRCDLGRPSVA